MEIVLSGLTAYYTVAGAGPAVLILEGWGTNTEVYAPIARVLAEKYTVYTLDFPGFGKSEEPKDPWDVGDYANFTAAFIAALGLKRLSLVGHSYGGRVIFKLHEQPQDFEIERIVLIDAAGVKPKDTLRKKLRRIKYKAGRKALQLFAPDKVEKYRLRHSSADYRAASPMMREVLKKSVSEDLTHLFPLVKAPTLLVWGVNDTATPLSDAKLMEKTIPDAGLVELQGGHYSFLESPAVFERVLRSYFKL